MSPVSSVNSNSLSSIYGNRNVISGLASGMDTEAMIENAVSGIRTKIANLQRSSTKFQWKQEAYRSISDQLVQFSRKYTSYTSATNLMSSSFFDKAVKTTTGGEFSKYVSASGKSNSNVEILKVDQLATAARYATKTGGILGGWDSAITAGKGVDMGEIREESTIADSYMTFTYGTRDITIKFGKDDIFKDDPAGTPDGKTAAEKLAAAINTKLAEEKISVSGATGEQSASNYIEAKVGADGNIEIVHGANGDHGNNLFINNASASLKEALGFETGGDNKPTKLTVDPDKLVERSKTGAELVSGQKMTFTYNGTTKSINMPTITTEKKGNNTVFKIEGDPTEYDFNISGEKSAFNDAYIKSMQKSLGEAFGKNAAGDYNVQVSNKATDGTVQLEFKMADATPGNTLSISSRINTVLELDSTATSYLNTGKTLGNLLTDAQLGAYDKVEATGDPSKFTEVKDKDDKVLYKVDSEGYRVKEEEQADGTKKYYRVEKDDPSAYMFRMEVNGVEVGQFSKNSALESVMLGINGNTEAGVKVTYSKITNEFVFTAKETGSAGRIEIKEDLSGDGSGKNAAFDLFGKINSGESGYTAGLDAKATVRVNGTQMDITRSTNTFDMDGLSVTVNGTFDGRDRDAAGNVKTDANGNEVYDANKIVNFTTASDADKIVDAVKSMIEDYNKMVTSIREAYGTAPATKSDKRTRYEPLTEEEMADLSETAIKNYEEKAKQGLLFADQDLSSLYDKLKNGMTPAGTEGSYLRSIGITTDYTDGLTTIQLDENALRDALASNPDAVKDAFTRSKEAGAATNGIMQNLKNTLDTYARTDGENKGILIDIAGSKYSAISLMKNSLQDSMQNISDQITKWETKLSDKVDYYTRKFTQLEKLIAQMNSQSSALAGMIGSGQ